MVIDVAAGVLLDASGNVLLAQRPEGKHMAGFWEFPGGKFELGENAAEALARELNEELGIVVTQSQPLIQITHHYPDRSVRLHVRSVSAWQGQPQSLDQQALSWVAPEQLSAWPLLPADGPIVNAICLPTRYAISPVWPVWPEDSQPTNNQTALEKKIVDLAASGVPLLQWRQPEFAGDCDGSEISSSAWAQAATVAEICHKVGISVLLNGPVDRHSLKRTAALGFNGIHVNSRRLTALDSATDLKSDLKQAGLQWLAASCHCAEELAQAQKHCCDFAVLGPVLPTDSHKNATVLGWSGFERLLAEANVPVYALGGCRPSQTSEVQLMGGQGVAGIRAFWPA